MLALPRVVLAMVGVARKREHQNLRATQISLRRVPDGSGDSYALSASDTLLPLPLSLPAAFATALFFRYLLPDFLSSLGHEFLRKPVPFASTRDSITLSAFLFCVACPGTAKLSAVPKEQYFLFIVLRENGGLTLSGIWPSVPGFPPRSFESVFRYRSV